MDDAALMAELGIGRLPAADRQRVLEYAQQILQMRMSLRLAEEVTSGQLKQLETASRRGESEGQQELARLCPEYDTVYQEEVNKLKQDSLLL